MQGHWDGVFWRQAQTQSLDCYRPEGSDHHPRTFCRLLYNEEAISGIFRVEDQYVRSVHTCFQGAVWKDSCVEFFVQPKIGCGYFNFEFNCGGALLASYVTNPTRIDGHLQGYTPLTKEDDQKIQRFASLSSPVEPEITTPLVWFLEFTIPWGVLGKFVGPIDALKGQTWRANFYKCGNETSHPHWVSWTPLSACNFHEPANFGRIVFCD